MTVYPTKADRITVNQHLSVFYFNTTKTYRLFHLLYGLSVYIL